MHQYVFNNVYLNDISVPSKLVPFLLNFNHIPIEMSNSNNAEPLYFNNTIFEKQPCTENIITSFAKALKKKYSK